MFEVTRSLANIRKEGNQGKSRSEPDNGSKFFQTVFLVGEFQNKLLSVTLFDRSCSRHLAIISSFQGLDSNH